MILTPIVIFENPRGERGEDVMIGRTDRGDIYAAFLPPGDAYALNVLLASLQSGELALDIPASAAVPIVCNCANCKGRSELPEEPEGQQEDPEETWETAEAERIIANTYELYLGLQNAPRTAEAFEDLYAQSIEAAGVNTALVDWRALAMSLGNNGEGN